MLQSDQEVLRVKHDEELQQLAAQHNAASTGLQASHEQLLLDQQMQAESKLADKLHEAHEKAASDRMKFEAVAADNHKVAVIEQRRCHQESLEHALKQQKQEHIQTITSQAQRYDACLRAHAHTHTHTQSSLTGYLRRAPSWSCGMLGS